MNNQDVLEQQDDHQVICNKEITIYHVPSVKVGSTSNLKKRMSNQSIPLDEVEILKIIPANTMTYREVWLLEQKEAKKRGYSVEHEGNWKTFYNAHTSPAARDPDVLEKIIKAKSTPEEKKRMSKQAKKLWADPEFKKMRSDQTKKRWADPEYQKFQSEQTKKRMADPEKKAELSAILSDGRMAGFNNPHAKTANVYNREDKLIAAGVCIEVYARENGYGPASLQTTARADRSKPHNWKTNIHFHKGIYAVYVE